MFVCIALAICLLVTIMICTDARAFCRVMIERASVQAQEAFALFVVLQSLYDVRTPFDAVLCICIYFASSDGAQIWLVCCTYVCLLLCCSL